MPYTELVSTMTDHRRPATADMATEFRSLFVNRLAYTLQSTKPHPETGRHYYYRPKARDGGPGPALTLETVRRHLAGDITLGMYSINPKTQRSKWVAIDADYRNAIEDLLKLQYELTQDGVEPALEKSNRGGHLWIFFEAPALARDCRVYIYHTALRLGLPIKGAGLPEGIEIFPRQDEIGAQEFGNAIRAPLGVHRGAKESRGWRFWFYNADYTLADQLAYLARIRKLTEPELQRFIAGKTIPPEFAQRARRPEMATRYFTSAPTEFRILDYVEVRRQVGRNFVARCPSCARANRDQSGDNLAICVEEPRKYICWAGCTKEMIREALGRPVKAKRYA
jgi:TOTE conflict system primase-like protein